MEQKVKVALLQLTSGPDIAENVAVVEGMVRDAAGQGARFILTPENTCHMGLSPEEKLNLSPAADQHPMIARIGALANELKVWILLGSVAVKLADGKLHNRSIMFDADGNIVANYNKIHLFDVDLPTGEIHRESDTIQPGESACVVDMPWGKLGMAICYDLRFAYLFRALAQAGARILTVPAAFTVPTGQAHWHVLLRARAIETGSFVLAPAQVGTHHNGRKTYGHSLVIDPWGVILAEGDGEKPGIIMAELDLSTVDKARNAIPALKHDRAYAKP